MIIDGNGVAKVGRARMEVAEEWLSERVQTMARAFNEETDASH